MEFNYQASQTPMQQIAKATKPHFNVIFCIPGREFSLHFLQAWTTLVLELNRRRVTFILSSTYSPVVYYARTSCLRGHVLRGVDQLPFNGEITYDVIMWIDSDMVFNPENFFKLYDRMRRDKEIQCLAGVYPMADGKHTTIVKDWDEDFFVKNGTFQFLTMEEVLPEKEGDPKPLFEAYYAGFGWLMVRYGVHEQLKYPFFRPTFHTLPNGIYDFSSEDASWFWLLRQEGIKLHVDPNVRLGHEKMIVL